MSSGGMNEQALDRELRGDPAQLGGEPLGRFGPAVRVSLLTARVR